MVTYDREYLRMDSSGALSCPKCMDLQYMRLVGTRANGTSVNLEMSCKKCATTSYLVIRQEPGITFSDGHTTEGYVYVEWEGDDPTLEFFPGKYGELV